MSNGFDFLIYKAADEEVSIMRSPIRLPLRFFIDFDREIKKLK